MNPNSKLKITADCILDSTLGFPGSRKIVIAKKVAKKCKMTVEFTRIMRELVGRGQIAVYSPLGHRAYLPNLDGESEGRYTFNVYNTFYYRNKMQVPEYNQVAMF